MSVSAEYRNGDVSLPQDVAEIQRLRSLLIAALPYVDASERSYARRLTWAILHPNDPRATALHVAGGNCPEETTRAA
jgi:hypothetical protein